MFNSKKISGFLINYNGSPYIDYALKSLSFCDEVIFVDKSSTDGSEKTGKERADKFFSVPWSSIVEETRNFALSKCSGEWVIFLDHDEFVPVELAEWLKNFVSQNHDYNGVKLLRKNYYFGSFNKDQRNWPSLHLRFAKRKELVLDKRVHVQPKLNRGKIYNQKESDGRPLLHFGVESISQWLEKANRYTSAETLEIEHITRTEIFSQIEKLLNQTRSRTKSDSCYVGLTDILFFLYKSVELIKAIERVHYSKPREKYLELIEQELKKLDG